MNMILLKYVLCVCMDPLRTPHAELAIGPVELGRVNSGLGQNRVGPKLVIIFQAKILVAQPALKTGLVGPNSLLKAKKFRAGRTGLSHTGPGHIFGPVFFGSII